MTHGLLALFFLRDWALVLFLWKVFELLMVLLQATSTLLNAASHRPEGREKVLVTFLLAFAASYAAYTLLLLRQLWRMPRIRDHYRRLPTRRELPIDVGYLQFGSFFFRRQDVIGTGATGRVYKGMYAGTLVAVKEMASAHVPSSLQHGGHSEASGCSLV